MNLVRTADMLDVVRLAAATAWDEGHRSGYADCASDDAQVTGNPYRTTDPKGSNHG